MAASVHPVDEILPLPKLAALGLQHVLVMYANAVAVPLIVGGALHLPKDQIALLINADLFACGIATLIQTHRRRAGRHQAADHHGRHGGRDLADAGDRRHAGRRAHRHLRRGAGRGLFGLCVAPFVKYALRFFPAVVTGTIITMIGVVLMRVGVGWAGGGAGAADFGAPRLSRRSPGWCWRSSC